jgi:hypothetical protein
MAQADPLERWVDESIKRAVARGYHPTEFIKMRARHQTVSAMERLMQSGQIQSGLRRLKELGMEKEWSVEAGILKFPDRFTRQATEVAKFRLLHIDDDDLR